MDEKEEIKARRKLTLPLLKRYVDAFRLQGTTDQDILERWIAARGPMLAAGFLPGVDPADDPPVAWVAPDGRLWMEQNEDLLGVNEPAVAEIEENLILTAINTGKPIHPTE